MADGLGIWWWRPLAWIVLAALAAVPPGPSWGLVVVMLAAGAAALTAERVVSIPIRVVLIVVVAAAGVAAVLIAPRNGLGLAPLFVAALTLGRLVPWKRTVIGAGLVLTVLFALALGRIADTPWAMLSAIGLPFMTVRSWDREALRREHERVVGLLAELEERRDADVRAAATGERARIARDLHDVLAHTLSGLSLHLQAIRAVVARDSAADSTVVTALDRAADLARDGLGEARRAVAALREAPPPDAAALAALVDEHPGARLHVHGSFDALRPAWRETAFATVRESLTNAGRYAPGARVSVAVDLVDGLVVRVDDDGAATPVATTGPGSGHGLRGLAERAAAEGGSLEASPRERGWSVVLRVPSAPAPSGAGAHAVDGATRGAS